MAIHSLRPWTDMVKLHPDVEAGALTRDQVFKAFPAIANLADKSDGAKMRIHIESSSAAGFDPSWLRNAVEEPLDEADIDRVTE